MSRELKEREQFTFSGTLSEIPFEPKTDEQIQEQLFGKNFDPEKMVDAYEEQLGIKTREAQVPKTKIKSIMLSPGSDEEDNDLFEKLYNDRELYQVLEKSAYWTPRGEYKVFVIYQENLDIKEARLKEAAKKEKEESDEA